MVSHEVTRDPLYPTLTELFGQERGVEVLQRLPPPGAEPATRQDMRDVVLRMDGLEQRMDGLEQRMSEFEQRVTRQMERFDDKLDRFHEGLRDQTRNVLLANAGMMLTLAAILIGVGVIS